MAGYSREIKRSAAREIDTLPTKEDRRLIVARITRLGREPRPSGSEKLSGETRYRVRQGPYRVVYEIDDDARVVRIVKVGHRRDVYRR